ncbi:hypothetical protein NLJ89_g59 [Agrocybe chaxingu]|uniref:Queuosine 5'-phosphate N-glycosylase/hydrolase n=1 Tax=Agrocybe chaxingu TaxID=84603 RepID=A0A9W8N2K4_9AGAR|nr:hypothetical protein NLJ89_g59 [Agrocybe chaxingu]
MSPPFPPSSGFLQAIRQSSKELRIASGISITPDHIKRLLSSPTFTTSFNRVSKHHGLTLPLKFSSHLDELNFLSVLSLLNFGSGYRVPLHTATGRGAWDSVRALTFSLHLTSTTGDGDLLSAKGLQTIDVAKVAELLGVSLHVEKPHDKLPGVVVGELGGPLYEFVGLVVSTLNQTGEILENLGYVNLGAFVAEALGEAGKVQGRSDDAAVEVVLERIVRAFPGFRDMAEVNRQGIYCFKKALFLIHAITIRFGSLRPPPFPVPNTNNIPVFSDNVLPSLLVHLGIIDLPTSGTLSNLFPDAGSDEKLKTLLNLPSPLDVKPVGTPQKKVPKEGPVLTADQSYILRAAAIDACELIIEAVQSLDPASLNASEVEWLPKITLPDLDMWIWAVAKDRSDYRALERFVARDTVYF